MKVSYHSGGKLEQKLAKGTPDWRQTAVNNSELSLPQRFGFCRMSMVSQRQLNIASNFSF